MRKIYIVHRGNVFEGIANPDEKHFAWIQKEEAEDCLFSEDCVRLRETENGVCIFRVFEPHEWDNETIVPGFLDRDIYVTFDAAAAKAVAEAWRAGREAAFQEVKAKLYQLLAG